VRLSPEALRDWLVARGATVSFVPTPIAEPMVQLHWPASRLRYLLTGGDRLSRMPPEGLPFCLVNNYGPTENSVVSTYVELAPRRDELSPPIGRPVDGTQVYVLDAGLRLVPEGVVGEAYLGGASLARGYRNRPEGTGERFLPDPFSVEPGARMYRSGDLVRWSAEGLLEYLGRADFQVKVRGFRIEVGEIEAALEAQPEVAQAVVVLRGPGEDKRLVGYVVSKDEAALDNARLLEPLKARLPEYMVPSAIVLLDELPLTPNGKVDRKALPEPDFASSAGEYVGPRTATEEVLAGIWAEVLKAPRVGIHDDFFALGGHSLLAARVVTEIRELLEIPLPLAALFDARTVAGLAERLRQLDPSRRVEEVAALVLEIGAEADPADSESAS
jgi:acyl-CoA synthetase (AMP-forming)/AMP-acid ligase II/acyl carrier protein